MEALGVASGAAGILSLGIAVCQGLLQYYGSWKDAESEVAGMYESIEALTHILLLLLPVIEHRDLDRNVVALIENHIASCQQGIEQLRKKLDKVKITPLQPGSRGKAKTQFWKTLYPFKESTLIKLKGIGNELRDQLSLSLDVLHIDASTASLTKLDILSQYVTEVSTDVTFLKQKSGLLSSNINTLSNSVEKSSIGVDALILGQSNEYLLKVFRWFSPLLGDFERKQLDTFNLKARQGGVGKWLLETQKFNDWFLGNGEILWCPGKQGAGKTVLVSFVINHLQKSLVDTNIGIAYIYCNYKEAGQQSLTNLIASLVHQLVRRDSVLASDLASLYESHITKDTRPSRDEYAQLLQIAAASFTKVFIIIDALDECVENDGTRQDLLEELRKLQLKACLLVTSRDLPSIQRQLRSATRLEIQASDDDIMTYLCERISSSEKISMYVKRDPGLHEVIVKTITGKARGMFLQARLHLDSLFTKTDLRKFKAALNSLPEGLDETYDEVMSRTLAQHPDYIALARKVIYWVFYAVRPLTLKEIQHALAVEPDDTFLDEDSIVDEELLISVCTGIITVQHESDVVGLVHYTAQQYLERKAVEYFPEAQDEILRTCLTYLSFKEFDKGPCRKVKKLEARLKSWPLLRYAAQHWAEHASFKKSAFQNSNLLQGLANKSSSGRADDPSTHQNLNISGSQAAAIVPRGQVVNQTDLKRDESLLSVILGQPDSQVDILSSNTSDRGVSNLELITRFLNQGAKVASSMEVAALKNVFRFSLHTRTFTSNISPLCVCAFFNLESIAQLLLYKGASTLIKDDCGTTPLHFTALYGNEAMTQTLLEHGAEIAARDLWDSTPLHQAALRGHEAVLRALLIKGADVVAEDVRGYTPLHEAVLQGHCMVTNTLLEYGADLTAQSRAKETPLHVAAGNSFNAVTRLLLEKGADVNIKDDRGRTPLHVFIMGGTSLMALFLKNAADLTIKDDGGMTVLHFAAQYGRKSLTRLLLESGAETESTDNHERTPLHLAARIEHKALVEILIKGGASLGARDDQGMTALHYAAESENESIMQLLLDYGANIKSRDRDGRSVMDITFHMCNRSATQLLLRNGADTFGHSKDWGSKLQAAAQKGDENMVQLLLEFGANIHASGGLISQGRNALHLACGAGSSGCVEVLLKYGSDPHILDGQKRTCLHHAASSDSAKALTRLLKEGLDPMVGDIDGWTSIDWAAKAGRLTNIKILSEAVAGPINTWKPKSIAIYHGQMSIADYLETLSQRSMENVVEGPPNEAFPTETPRRIREIEYLPSGSVGRPVPNGGPNIQDFPSGNLESEFVSGRAELTDIGKCQLQAMPAPQHLRVWCDGCDLPICGSRYKCSVCANFDYCFKCVASSHDNHSSHHFMAVEGPNVIYHKPKSDARSQNAADYVL